MDTGRDSDFSLIRVPAVLFSPASVFSSLAGSTIEPRSILLRYALWIGLLPPGCAWFGMTFFGWRLGLDEPMLFTSGRALAICAAYYLLLLLGFVAAAKVLLWMRPTYAARAGAGACYALVAIVGTPMMLGGVFHLYPLVSLNVAVLVPTLIWSVWLLYAGAAPVLQTSQERAMLMASAMLGFLLVALASFLAIIVLLWGVGLGPELGV